MCAIERSVGLCWLDIMSSVSDTMRFVDAVQSAKVPSSLDTLRLGGCGVKNRIDDREKRLRLGGE